MIVRFIVWGIALVVFGAAFWLGLGGLKTRKTVHFMMVLRHFMIVFVSCSRIREPIEKVAGRAVFDTFFDAFWFGLEGLKTRKTMYSTMLL